MVSRLRTRFSDSNCKRCCPGKEKVSQEILLAAWNLLLSKRQKFLNNHLTRVPDTPNQQGTNEVRDELLSSIGVQDMDTSGYQVSDLDVVEFYWESDQLGVDAVFSPGCDSPFSPTALDDLEKGGSAENAFLLEEEEDKENSPPTTPVSERPTTCIAVKSCIWNKIRKCSCLCL